MTNNLPTFIYGFKIEELFGQGELTGSYPRMYKAYSYEGALLVLARRELETEYCLRYLQGTLVETMPHPTLPSDTFSDVQQFLLNVPKPIEKLSDQYRLDNIIKKQPDYIQSINGYYLQEAKKF